MDKVICPQCGGTKVFMTEKKTKKGLDYIDCDLCDDNGTIEENFFDETEMDY